MNSDLYNAAAGGDIKKISDSELLESQETPQKNTVLHVAVQVASARNEKGPYFEKEKIGPIGEICKLCPALIRRVNSKGDTPLHIAARGGRSDIVKLLVDEDVIPRSLVTMVNSKKDTALHEALRNHHLFDRKYQKEYLEVVKTLLQKEPELSNFINDAGESPAFMAAREGLCDFLVVILNLDCCKEYGGPGKSTALHAAVLLREDGEKTGIYDLIQSAKTAGGTRNIALEIIKKLMEKNPGLIREEDESKRIPLHYAANLSSDKKVKDSHERVRKLLDLVPDDHNKPSIVYHQDINGMTALHYAARAGANKSIDVLIEHCPDCFEQVDNRGWTTLHFAVAGGSDSTIKYIIKNEKLKSISMAMVNEHDNQHRDTPLHLAARISNSDALSFLMDIPQVDRRALNGENKTPLEIFKATETNDISEQLEKESLKKKLKKKTAAISSEAPDNITEHGGSGKVDEKKTTISDSSEQREFGEVEKSSSQQPGGGGFDREVLNIQLLVATLIATVTFAAGFTMPGGYNPEGMANLSSNGAFELFVFANTAALALSTAVIFFHLYAVKNYSKADRKKIDRFTNKADLFIILAIIGMVIAFVTSAYLVLSNNPRLAIRVTILGCFIFFGSVGPRLLVSLSKYCYKYLSIIIPHLLQGLLCSIVIVIFIICPICWFIKDSEEEKKAGDDVQKKPTREGETKPLQTSTEVLEQV